MSTPRVLCLTSRTAAILLPADGAYFALAAPLAWTLEDAGGGLVMSGTTDIVALFLDDLTPNSRYILRTPIGEVEFLTRPCAGLIDARDFGVSPEHPNNAAMLAQAIAAVPTGGTLRITAGRYLSGPVFLKPEMTLLLDSGTELAAISDRADWPQLPAHDKTGRVIGTWEGLPERSFAALLTAIDCHGLALTGRGIIDGGGDRGDWWEWPKETREGARRPRTVQIAHSSGVSLSGLNIRNSPSWTVHPYRCRDVTVACIRIDNPPDSPNTDGLNPESCTDVAITGVDFSVGDDCIAIKAGKRGPGDNTHLAPSRNIAITQCRMQRGHGAVVLGSEMSGDIRDITVAHCTFDRTDRGLRLKTRRGRGGMIADVRCHDIVMTDVPTPFAANAFYHCDPDGHDPWVQSRAPRPVDATTPEIKGIDLRDVTAHRVSLAAIALLGLPEAPITNVSIRNFAISFDPAAQPGLPLMADGMEPVRHADLIAINAEVDGQATRIAEPEADVPC